MNTSDAPIRHETPIRVDHIGIAVESVEEAEPILFALGCERISIESVEDRFNWAYYRLGDASRLELIEPIADDTFLTDFLDANGPGLHHVTLEVADIDAVIESLRENEIRVIDRAEFDTWTEAFVSPRNPTGALFQLMEYHDDYHEERLPPQELFINESRVGELFQG
ncbi:methylmalonyl-CoA/ethylmalonyl-CoA epimerase [Haladaptatus litoreus]|uniref:Methylmalonyl-CoA/ethylmalonyl-CoA epimerase n=1 Tax=Haladaptatus litoreus TaxID=553468 RepID=A0A1N7DZ68_9EURY|nr:VOC family protein [Haladaptatus litoreus]SIR81119.1 methylmalonyl-CoA/ethylmalonyl-CoA epimerase [Haladaptatus litoreus]